MPDLLSHVLLAYALCAVVGVAAPWVDARYLTVAMAGALLPDLAKARLLWPNTLVRDLLGVPFSWAAIHSVGAVAVWVLLGAALVRRGVRARVAGLLALGGVSHLCADLLLRTATGYSPYPMLWPLSRSPPPTAGLFLSSDPWPLVGSALLAGVVWYYRRTRTGVRSDSRA